MYGAILGDIAGSRFEFSKPSGFNYKTVSLFGSGCAYTDDTVMTQKRFHAVFVMFVAATTVRPRVE